MWQVVFSEFERVAIIPFFGSSEVLCFSLSITLFTQQIFIKGFSGTKHCAGMTTITRHMVPVLSETWVQWSTLILIKEWHTSYGTQEPTYKTKTDSQTWRTDLWLPKGREWVDWELGVSRCQLLHLEWISKEVLLYITGNYIQSPGTEHDGRYYGKKNVHIYIYITGSLCCTAEIGVTLSIKYTSIKQFCKITHQKYEVYWVFKRKAWFAFPWWLATQSIFSCASWPFVYVLWRNIYPSLLPI